jgi:hypothetical protein
MKDAVEGGRFPGEPSVILYTPKWRSFGLVIGGDPDDQFILRYCPFCCKKLPEDLVDAHFDAIRDENGDGRPLDPLPEEFKTDEWWKKRGL